MNENSQSCLQQLDSCILKLRSNETLDEDQIYAAASELYMARALNADKNKPCAQDLTLNRNKRDTVKIKNCLDQQLSDFDLSLRYSYVYLFKMPQAPESRLFDLRQGQVALLHKLVLKAFFSNIISE